MSYGHIYIRWWWFYFFSLIRNIWKEIAVFFCFWCPICDAQHIFYIIHTHTDTLMADTTTTKKISRNVQCECENFFHFFLSILIYIFDYKFEKHHHHQQHCFWIWNEIFFFIQFNHVTYVCVYNKKTIKRLFKWKKIFRITFLPAVGYIS